MALTAVSNPKARRKPAKRAAVLITQPLNTRHSTTRKGNCADRARQQAADAAVSTPSNRVQSDDDMEEDYGSGFELAQRPIQKANVPSDRSKCKGMQKQM
jgi:hypothetical protein